MTKRSGGIAAGATVFALVATVLAAGAPGANAATTVDFFFDERFGDRSFGVVGDERDNHIVLNFQRRAGRKKGYVARDRHPVEIGATPRAQRRCRHLTPKRVRCKASRRVDPGVAGGEGDDRIVLRNSLPTGSGASGGPGDDVFLGTRRVNGLIGDSGNDTLRAKRGDDFLEGDEGDDLLLGGRGDDHLAGEMGNDTLRAGRGRNRLYGGLGFDRLFAVNDRADVQLACLVGVGAGHPPGEGGIAWIDRDLDPQPSGCDQVHRR